MLFQNGVDRRYFLLWKSSNGQENSSRGVMQKASMDDIWMQNNAVAKRGGRE
jgi:hypothetical protein